MLRVFTPLLLAGLLACSPRGSVPAPAPAEPASEPPRSLLEQAFVSLVHGDGDAALAALREHGEKFPEDRALDRAFLEITALCNLGRDDEAVARALELADEAVHTTDDAACPIKPRGCPLALFPYRGDVLAADRIACAERVTSEYEARVWRCCPADSTSPA